MRIYPNADINFYVDKPGTWGNYLKHGVTYSWKKPVKRYRPKKMNYWRDFDAVRKVEIKDEDLYFKNWPESRIRPQACLGMLYSTGFRFIRLSMAPPANFKCAPLPVNLETAHKVNILLKKKAKAARLARKKARKAKRDKKNAKKAFKNRGKRRGKQ